MLVVEVVRRPNIVVDSWIGLVTNGLACVMVEVGVSDVTTVAIVSVVARLESCAVDGLAGMLVGVLAEGRIWIVSGIDFGMLLELNVNDLAAATTLEFTMPAPLEKPWCFC